MALFDPGSPPPPSEATSAPIWPGARFGEEHLPPPEVLDRLLPPNDGPRRPPSAPSWAARIAGPILDALRGAAPSGLAERHGHRLLFARWLRERGLLGEWGPPDA
jgi:hypothetical protein